MLWIIWAQFDAALGLLNDVKLVALAQLETCQQLLRQDQASRIANLFDLKNKPLGVSPARTLIHGDLRRCTKCITEPAPSFNNCFTACKQLSLQAFQLLDHPLDDPQPA